MWELFSVLCRTSPRKNSIKNLTLILETIADMAPITKNPDELSEQARRRLGMYFVKEFEVEPEKLLALTFDPSLEQSLIGRVKEVNLI